MSYNCVYERVSVVQVLDLCLDAYLTRPHEKSLYNCKPCKIKVRTTFANMLYGMFGRYGVWHGWGGMVAFPEHGMAWCGMAWGGMVRHGITTVWHGTTRENHFVRRLQTCKRKSTKKTRFGGACAEFCSWPHKGYRVQHNHRLHSTSPRGPRRTGQHSSLRRSERV